jgi:hypothetical protein
MTMTGKGDGGETERSTTKKRKYTTSAGSSTGRNNSIEQ